LALGYSLGLGLGLSLPSSPLPIPFPPYIAAAAAAAIMSATPPPPSPPPPPLANSPPTSPQLHQQAIRNQERLQRDRVSPDLHHRIPSITSATLSNALPPPPLPLSSHISAPVTFNGQSFNHLPAHIVAAMRNMQPFPTSFKGRRNPYSLPVSSLFIPLII